MLVPVCVLEETYSWSFFADMTHEKQVNTFGWCSCEDNDEAENPFEDCSFSDPEHLGGANDNY